VRITGLVDGESLLTFLRQEMAMPTRHESKNAYAKRMARSAFPHPVVHKIG
jgi:hypothetical protein